MGRIGFGCRGLKGRCWRVVCMWILRSVRRIHTSSTLNRGAADCIAVIDCAFKNCESMDRLAIISLETYPSKLTLHHAPTRLIHSKPTSPLNSAIVA